ncbi:Imm52 family immunity protein [Trinickia sp. EG282A]|uniref:Imm52 family immunity protein n=1 Tax=Trinickia sp. EG282A TaxID=3237013 RepID=UPI0034D2654D
MQVTLIFRLQQAALPSQVEHLRYLWKIAKLLEPFGFPMQEWYPPAATPKKSLETPAFDRDGPTPAAVEMLRAEDKKYRTTDYRITSVWNGKQKAGGSAFYVSFSTDSDFPICVFKLQFQNPETLDNAKKVQQLMLGLLDVWPAASEIEVGPLMYYTTRKVFRNKPGAGWMLYLAKIVTTEQLPEAAGLLPVMEGDKQRGTIIVSIANEVFSVDNPEHVKIANAIEVRLADQDLLCR